MRLEEYFEKIESETKRCYQIAGLAKEKGIDPVGKIEVPIAMTLAEKTVGLISVVYPQLEGSGIVERIIELEKEYGQLDSAVAFKIAEEIAKEKYCKFKDLMEAIDAGVRVGFSYITLGVVSSPIEGFTGIKIAKTKDGKEYFVAYFSGPIRSAGTTAGCMVLMLIDYLRETFGYAKFDPEENEVKRYVTENYDYHERVNNLQYLPTEDEIKFLAARIPIQISGEPTEDREVSNYKDLARIETNYIRGGMCLIFSEGLAQKAQKGFRLWKGVQGKGFKVTGWEFLEEYIAKFKMKKAKGAGDGVPTYMKDIVAGRPIFCHPGRSGGFRFRYGRTRTSGFSAAAVHPATMAITDSFISFGTQLKIEKPTKGCVVSVCDEIDGPIVKFKNGSVKRIQDYEEAKKAYKDVGEIIYLGDLLVPFGDVANRNYDLLKAGYVEEWWLLELKKAGFNGEIEKFKVGFEEAKKLSAEFKIPLHPKYIFYWSEISQELFLGLIDWLAHGHLNEGKIVLPYNHQEKERFSKGKKALEVLGCEHEVSIENVVIPHLDSEVLLFNLGMNGVEGKLDVEIDRIIGKFRGKESEKVLDLVNLVSFGKIKDKGGTFIGARMGRPEKAKLRKLEGSPHMLFPVGEEGGRLRSLQAAVEVGSIKSEFPVYYCLNCKLESVFRRCEECKGLCEKRMHTPENSYGNSNEKREFSYKEQRVDIKRYFELAKKQLGLREEEFPVVKGVRGTSNKDHDCESITKGILRAKHNLNVNKDGTIRYDMTEMVITHFKPKEIGTSVAKLKELGYEKDINGLALENDEQIIELFPHDVILPACPVTGDEPADDVFLNIAQFIDDELEKIYGLEKTFNAKTKEDVLGALLVCIAPHICTATVGRLIGFSKNQTMLASPYMHAAMRRDCFAYESYIPIKEKDAWKIVKIGDFVENLNPDKIVDNFGTKESKVEEMKAVGFMEQVGEVDINNFTKHTKMPLLKIKTKLGKELKVTENHKFLVSGKIKLAKELMLGDKLPLPIKINIDSRDIREINLLEELKDEDLMVRGIGQIVRKLSLEEKERVLRENNITSKQFVNYVLRDSYPIKFVLSLGEDLREEIIEKGKIAAKRDNVNLPIKISLTDDLLEVVGLYISEGYSRSIGGKNGLNQVYIASLDGKTREFVAKTIKEIFGLKPSEKKEDRVTFSSKVFYLLFEKILKCGSVAREKRIPSLLLNLPLERLACVLRGYFEGDGSAEKNRMKVCCDSVSDGLLFDLEFCLSRFGIFVKRYTYEKEPGQKLKEFYIKKNRKIPKFKITKLIIGSDFINNFKSIGFLSDRKNRILENYEKMKPYGMEIEKDNNFVYDSIVSIENMGEKESYCLNVNTPNHLVAINSIMSKQCDGDEAAVMLLMDLLLNFSRKFLPAHRGGTQDAPLVLNARIRAGDVDDQILDFETGPYPLELYEMSEQGKHSSEIKTIDNVKIRLKNGIDPFTNMGFTHGCNDINHSVLNSSYKSLPTMAEKVESMMILDGKIRAVDIKDVARLVIERHFIRDTRGNLRKFSQQGFRCSSCNSKFRRVPLMGKCTKCGGRIIFTISEGSILKYMQPALDMARRFGVSQYLLESLELNEMYIQSIFGKEKEKQMKLF